MLSKVVAWILRLVFPQFVLNLLGKLFKMPFAEDSPDMHAFVDMAAAALQSKNHFIYSQQERLEQAEATVVNQQACLLRLEQELARLKLELVDGNKDVEIQKALVNASESRLAEVLAREEQVQAELSLVREEKLQESYRGCMLVF